MADKLKVTYRSVSSLKPYGRNARTHSAEQVAQMRPRRLGQLYIHLLPLVFLDPLKPSRPTASQPGAEIPAPAPSDPTALELDSPARSAGRTRKSTP